MKRPLQSLLIHGHWATKHAPDDAAIPSLSRKGPMRTQFNKGIVPLVCGLIYLCSIAGLSSVGSPRKAIANEATLLQQLDTARSARQRIEILDKLSHQRDNRTRKRLEKIALDDGQPANIRMQAVCSLSGSATRASVPALIRIIEKDLIERNGFWACAIPILGRLKDRRALPLLKNIANLSQPHLAGMDHMAIVAIANLASKQEVGFLERRAFVVPVRVPVMRALARLAQPSSAETLIGGLSEGENPEVIQQAEVGLLKIGKAALPALRQTLRAPGDKLQKARIRRILERIAQ